ncbi:hypothetical protein [Mucilaginibacter lappiensis]|uniref:hypothetical protein n=1 Tax=Mucilaginibacter lappiensis TaxID=354630 RepID=UPI003D1F0C1D
MTTEELIKLIDDYYPQNIALNDPQIRNHNLYVKLLNICKEANQDQGQWPTLMANLKSRLNLEITEFVLLAKANPSFIAVFLTENYKRPKPEGYEPCQLILKVSVIAPVFSIYFDNLVSDWNYRQIRSNPISEKERLVYSQIQETVTKFYHNFSHFDVSGMSYMLPHLGDISILNKRKPFLDECIFGLYLSTHPYNYIRDSFDFAENNLES